MIKEWKDIDGYTGLYQVSNEGEVRSIERMEKYRKTKRLRKGKNISINYNSVYGRLHLSKEGIVKNYSIHRLVAGAFLGLDIKNQNIKVLHIDDNPKNNHVDNLKLGTQLENIRDCIKKKRRSKSFIFNKKLSITQVKEIKRLIIKKKKQKDIAKIFNISESTISQIKKGNQWSSIN